ncbi:hypothetical protein B1992_02150 [Pseudoxanthomonas broegbernensis]|uniref:Methyltransferase type 11 domain-containing protein n=1 Tax=Pseudoxanthomonas broegbernensis TaxID=83619 RepID=A0A7V8K872_9GAMM|nr:hypothetical protein [Pseudoxanthomonas broegbernensis]KAF1687495.1 hypothetical protein B1992_02150 [Pseudoxanthomonas broegbernensis]MBB6064498.1 SAM-dependent methyltransferase [Pseudoxanthomonas broegbernensis]
MPAIASSRQPGAPIWFSGREGQWLLAMQRQWLLARLEARPARSWLWIAPVPAEGGALPARRGLFLHPDGHGYRGGVRCGLPLPLPSGCLGDVVLQHPPAARLDELIEEGRRLLIEGGRLWLCAFNPYGPLRWRGTGARWAAPSVGQWQRRLSRAGLVCAPPRFIGPRWRLGETAGAESGCALSLRAGCVIEAEKRAALPSSPASLHWRRGAAPAA